MLRLTRFGSRLLRLAAALLLGPAAVTGVVAPAQASIPQTVLTCEGAATVAFDPPLVNTPRPTQLTFHEDLDYCPTGGVTSGDGGTTLHATTGCTALNLPPTFTVTYHWNTRQSSTVAYTATTATRLVNSSTVVTSQGTVTSGLDLGSVVVDQVTLPQPDLTACAASGVTQVTGPVVLAFG